MEHSYLQIALPFLSQLDSERQRQFEEYFKSAPIWVIDALTTENVPKGTVFIHENEPADTIIFVGRGKVKATDYRVSGIAFDFLKLDNMIALGGMEVLMDIKYYRTTIETETDCILVKLPRAYYEKWINNDTDTYRIEVKYTCASLLDEVRRNRLYLFLEGADRLTLLYVTLYEKHKRKGLLCIKESRMEMANETGLSLKSISRAIKKFTEEGLVTKRGNQILIDQNQYKKLKEIINEKIDSV